MPRSRSAAKVQVTEIDPQDTNADDVVLEVNEDDGPPDLVPGIFERERLRHEAAQADNDRDDSEAPADEPADVAETEAPAE